MAAILISAAILQNGTVMPEDTKNTTILGCNNLSSVHIVNELLNSPHYKDIFSSIFTVVLHIMYEHTCPASR